MTLPADSPSARVPPQHGAVRRLLARACSGGWRTSWANAIVVSLGAMLIVFGQTWKSAHDAGGAPVEHVRIVAMQARNDAGEGLFGMGDCLGRGSGSAVTLTLRSSDAPAGRPATFTADGCSRQLHVGDTTTARRVGSGDVQIRPPVLSVTNVLVLGGFITLTFVMTALRRRREAAR